MPASANIVINATETAQLKNKILSSGLSVSELVKVAWASASTFRGSDKRGGANGARIQLVPQKNWEANNPTELAKVLTVLEGIQTEFNASGTQVSMADLIVLGGSAAIEKASENTVNVDFTPGRTDATAEQTDEASFDVLEPKADGFRNFKNTHDPRSTEALLVDKAALLTLTAPEMTVLVGGLRALGATVSKHGVFTSTPGVLSNDFFVNLLDQDIDWKSTDASEEEFEGYERTTGNVKWIGTRADLVFGSNSILRGIAEVYAANDAQEKFANDFVSVWVKVMNLDRFDLV